jgi:GNAT superfamily N-acetyltransferase
MTGKIEKIDGVAEPAIDVFCDAFASYPVMRFVVGDGHDDYPARLRSLITMFVTGRIERGHPVQVLEEDGKPIAAVTLTPPADSIYTPPGTSTDMGVLDALAADTWHRLGHGAATRYERFVAAATAVEPEAPNWHVNMLGVVGTAQGRGLARPLLEAVHARSAADPASRGVTLTTEEPRNVAFYRHFGYEVVREEPIAEGLRTWGFFRPDEAR